jgi:hypothetical protein
LDASSIIWIATQFSEEHIKALDWLNDHTTEDFGFYGVQVELWQIDDSKPAIRFNVVSKPNEAVRIAAKTKANEELSESKKFQLEFWTRFRDKLASTKRANSSHTPRAQYWYNVSLGKSNIHISNTCNTDQKTVGIRIYISNKIAETMLPFLETKKSEIEAAIGEHLNWNPNPENRDKIIQLLHQTDFNDPTRVEEALNWLVEYTIKFRDVFSKIVAKVNVPGSLSISS